MNGPGRQLDTGAVGQALDDAALRFLGRLHDVNEGLAALDVAQRHFARTSFDLIYARPGQTAEQWAAELDRALALNPAYIALGPIWPTLLKQMPWHPQGLAKLTRWKSRIGAVPLVAIGGLTPARLSEVFAAGADVAAVVTDLVTAHDPKAQTRLWVQATGAIA